MSKRWSEACCGSIFLSVFGTHALQLHAQVMQEGERLSKKQLAQESTIKKLRAGLKEAGDARSAQDASLASERQRLQDALSARAAAEDSRQVTEQACSGVVNVFLAQQMKTR